MTGSTVTLRESVDARRDAAAKARHEAGALRMAAFLAARAARAREAAEQVAS